MSKYCPMCDAVTNCTDNCKACFEEETKEMKTKRDDDYHNWYFEEED